MCNNNNSGFAIKQWHYKGDSIFRGKHLVVFTAVSEIRHDTLILM